MAPTWAVPGLFRLCGTFFESFFTVLKGSALQFVLIFCNRANVKKSQRVPSFRFFGTMRVKNSHFFVFFRKFFEDSNGFPFNFFEISQQNGC